MFAGHKLKRAVGTKVQHRIRTKVIAQPAVEVGERVGGCEAAFEQHPHGVALVTHGRLDTDQHIAERLTQHEQVLPIGPFFPRSGPPLRLDLG